jgi:RNA polymerase sigma-70 factor, ECF subfamily
MIRAVGRKTGSHETSSGRADEADLVRRLRACERDAQDAFYRAHRRQVAANLYRVLGDRTDLDDLVQEVFVIAFRGIQRFRGEARLSTWIFRICVNVALGRIRARGRRPPPVPLDPADAAESGLDSPESPARLLERKQAREKVYRVLRRLSPKKRAVLYLHEIEGLDLKEIAFVVDAHPVTVRTRLFYARRDFFRLVAAEGDELEGEEGDR